MPQVVDLRKLKKNKFKKKSTKNKEKTATLEWTAAEFKYYKKNKKWFFFLFLIGFILVIIAILSKNFLFALGVIISCFVIYLYANKKPKKIKFALKGNGIKVGKQLYLYENLRSFWINYHPPHIKELSLRSKKSLVPYIKIPLGNQNPVEVRRFLLKYLPEKEHEESIIDNWTKKLGF